MRLRHQDFHTRSDRHAVAEAPEEMAQWAPSESGLGRAVRLLRHDDAALIDMLREHVPSWQRLVARIVLCRELGADRSRGLCARAFGPTGAEFPMVPAPARESATPGVLARWDFARARALDHALAAVQRFRLDQQGLSELFSSFEPHVVRSALSLQASREDDQGPQLGGGRPAPPGPDAPGAAVAVAVERHAATLFRREAASGDAADPDHPAVEEALRQRGAGAPLPDDLRQVLEAEFGVDLRHLRVHVDEVAARAAAAVHAVAFTVGEDIFFSAGAFAPNQPAGRRLIAHEVAHVVQGYQGRAQALDGRLSHRGDPLEEEAEVAARRHGSAAAGAARPLEAEAPRTAAEGDLLRQELCEGTEPAAGARPEGVPEYDDPDRPKHERVYEHLRNQGLVTEDNYEDFLSAQVRDEPIEFLGQGGVEVHRSLRAILQQAQEDLRAEPSWADIIAAIRTVTGLDPHGVKHRFGLAIDINYAANPYIMHEAPAEVVAESDAAPEHPLDEDLAGVFDRISLLVLGQPSALADTSNDTSFLDRQHTSDGSGRESRETGPQREARVYDRLREESDAMASYFQLMEDPERLRRHLQALVATEPGQAAYEGYRQLMAADLASAAPTPEDLPQPDASLDALVSQMRRDWFILTGRDTPGAAAPGQGSHGQRDPSMDTGDRPFWSRDANSRRRRDDSLPEEERAQAESAAALPEEERDRTPTRGFLDLPRELVLKLTGLGLRWGAADFGGASGDVMHFDGEGAIDLADEVTGAAAEVSRWDRAWQALGRECSAQRSAPEGAPSDPSIVLPTAQAGIAGDGQEVPFRAEMEAAFGASFSEVRAHTDFAAISAARRIGAEAYTVGSHVAFVTASPSRELVAHELTHVLQQRGGAVPTGAVGHAGDEFERAAQDTAQAVARHAAAAPRGPAEATRGLAAPRRARSVAGAPSSVQRSTIGWLDLPSEDTWNAGAHDVDARGRTDGEIDGSAGAAVQRIPLAGLQQPPATGRVIVIVPGSAIAGRERINVLVHFHGHGYGNLERPNEGGDDTERTNDLHVNHIAQQVATADPPLIAILPQFTNEERLDSSNYRSNSSGDNDPNTPAMITEVFEQLKLHEVLTRAPDQQPGPVTISGHSAGGAVAMREYEQFPEEAEAGQAAGGATAPPEIERSNALFLFDGHIPDDQLEEFLHERLEEDRTAMEGMTEAEQLQYLAGEGFFLRSYANTSGYEPSEDPRVHAAAMQGMIDRWFLRLEEGENDNVQGFTNTVCSHWYENYKVQRDERLEVEDGEGNPQRLPTHHDTMVSTGRVPRGGPHNPDYPPPAPQGTAERGHLERALTDDASRRVDHRALQRQEDQSAEECSELATGCEALTPEAIAGMLEQLAGGESVDGMERLRAALEHSSNADFSLVIQILDRCGQLQPLLQAMGSAPGDAAAGEERYEVPVLCFVLYNADAAQVDHDFEEANAIYNPHGVFLFPVSVRTITQEEVEEIRGYEMGDFAEGMPLDEGSQVRDGELEWDSRVTAELVARYVPRTAIAAFWASTLSGGDRGTSYGGRAPSGGSIEDMPKLVMIPTREPCDISFAHEIGHVLIRDEHSTRAGNLMNASVSDEACADGSQDDLTTRQLARIWESTLGWIRSAAPANSGEDPR